MARYIHQLGGWPAFTWNTEQVVPLLAALRNRQGRVGAYMGLLGFDERDDATLRALSLDVLKSTEIEGELLNADQVRSSVARRLGLDIAGLIPSDRDVDGIVDVLLDATQHYREPLHKERLLGWHSALFPGGRSGQHAITVGNWRGPEKGPMQVVSGPMGKERVHYEAPEAERLEAEMTVFLRWFNEDNGDDPVLKAAIAHFWFVTIHPFDDGNGRLARAIADMQLTRADADPKRFYSVSAQIRVERKRYYDILERTQRGSLDITEWLMWFLHCMDNALLATEDSLQRVLQKTKFWNQHLNTLINERQRLLINKLFDGFNGNLNSSKWAKIAKCSADTALRDISDLLAKGILEKTAAGGRSTSYVLKGQL